MLVSGTAASSPSWSGSNEGIDWLHAVISLQIHRRVQAFLARLRPRFAVQLLQGAPPCNHHSVACCKPDDTSHFTARTYFDTISNITSNKHDSHSMQQQQASKKHEKQASTPNSQARVRY